ncbi:IS1595 family transposase [candidate division KSB1 bacterium]|nr:IS1595 family transposase [candidate division KSB1 bacterium]
MQQSAISLYEFHSQFPDEAACRAHLFQMRWPDGFVCPRCEATSYSVISTRAVYQCTHCHTQTSVTAGTLFHKSKVPLYIWFWVLFLVAKDKRGVSALRVSQEFPVSYPTAWRMLHKIRFAMAQRDAQYPLAGIIEVDEAYFGAPTIGKKRGRGTDQTPVLVALAVTEDQHPRFAKMRLLPNLEGATIQQSLTQTTAKGSTLQTDAFPSYHPIPDRQHQAQKAYQVDLREAFKWVHTLISNTKAGIVGTYHGLDSKYLGAYLDEYCYRFNRRFWHHQLFGRLVNACVHAPPRPIAEIC